MHYNTRQELYVSWQRGTLDRENDTSQHSHKALSPWRPLYFTSCLTMTSLSGTVHNNSEAVFRQLTWDT